MSRNPEKRKMYIAVIFSLVVFFSLGYFSGSTVEKNLNRERSVSNQTVTVSKEKVTPQTTIVFSTEYEDRESLTVKESIAPSSIVGMTQNQVKEYFHDWDLEKFSSEKIVLKRKLKNAPKTGYKITSVKNSNGEEVVGLYEINENGEEKLMRMYDTPVSIFGKEAMDTLKEGIFLENEEELKNILQNYVE